MYPVILIAALARDSNIRFRIAKGDDGVRHDGLRQAEQLLLGFYPVHLGPGAQPDCTKPKLLRGKADILRRDCTVNDPIILCQAECTVEVAADEDASGGVSQRFGRAAIFSGSVTTTNDQSFALTQLGPLMAASNS